VNLVAKNLSVSIIFKYFNYMYIGYNRRRRVTERECYCNILRVYQTKFISTRPKHILTFTTKISAVSDGRCLSSDDHSIYVTECTQETLIVIIVVTFPTVHSNVAVDGVSVC